MLVLVLLANLALFALVLKTNSIVFADVVAATKEWQSLLPAGLGLVVCGIVNELLSPALKARLVFWRWRNPLPGSEAFTRYATADPRVDMERLRKKLGKLPTSPEEQNAAWYQLYKKVSGTAPITDAHRAFLFCRDYAAMAALLSVVLGGVVIWQVRPLQTVLVYLLVLATQYLVVRIAAANAGRRLVTNVLATT
ncbi:hypothetical protein [Caulobacter sp. NIBR2454]|uniref:hypothetical protein n=1 Tax=Caulobacter sp. NIBR2454 TaxID=3015996 RepID=UPI0022B6F1F0|nr:hypothetical protein [Caulobacter sp. NIBR2454]